MAEFVYGGGELELFAEAHNWKRYLARELEPFLRGHVLEVGAGMGATTIGLTRGLAPSAHVREWTALEPDAELFAALQGATDEVARARALPVHARRGVLADLPAEERFDTILYVDVLEHIQDDRGELARAVAHLAPGGRVAVLAPAHGRLFSEFDRQVGHHRRYDKRLLRSITPAGAELATLRYLDCVGLLASLANRLLLRASLPTPRQIRLWDGLMVPVSRVLDPLSLGLLGKSILAVWERRSQ